MSAAAARQGAQLQALLLDVLIAVEKGEGSLPEGLRQRLQQAADAQEQPPQQRGAERRAETPPAPRRRGSPAFAPPSPGSIRRSRQPRPEWSPAVTTPQLPPRVERLYSDAERRRFRQAEYALRAERRDASVCTFQPAVTSESGAGSPDRPAFWERYGGARGSEYSEEKQRRATQKCGPLRQPLPLEDERECTFTPRITPVSQRLADRPHAAPFPERLGGGAVSSRRLERLKEQEEKRVQAILKECTHTPNLRGIHRLPAAPPSASGSSRRRRRGGQLRALFRSLAAARGSSRADRRELLAVLRRHASPVRLLGAPHDAAPPAASWVDALAARWDGSADPSLSWSELESDLKGLFSGRTKAQMRAAHLHAAFARAGGKGGAVTRHSLCATLTGDSRVRRLLRAAGCPPGLPEHFSAGPPCEFTFADFCAELERCSAGRREQLRRRPPQGARSPRSPIHSGSGSGLSSRSQSADAPSSPEPRLYGAAAAPRPGVPGRGAQPDAAAEAAVEVERVDETMTTLSADNSTTAATR